MLRKLSKVVLAWLIYASLVRASLGRVVDGRRVIDMSYPYDENTIYWPTAKALVVELIANSTQEGGYWWQKENIASSTHIGTHLDAPCHFARGKWCLTDIPFDRMVAPAVVVDVSDRIGNEADRLVMPEDLYRWEEKYGEIPDGTVLLVRTGWSRFWPDKARYLGSRDNDTSKLRFPSVSPETTRWIADNRGVFAVGIDTHSLDYPTTRTYEGHVNLFNKNIYGLENVANMDLLPPTGATLYVAPMKIKGVSGAPCRIYATVPENGARASASTVLLHVVGCCVTILWMQYR